MLLLVPRLGSTSKRLLSHRSLSSLVPPYGVAHPEEYVQQRDAATSFCIAQGYDADSLFEQQIAWSHHDAFHHVNNVHTFTFFESGRMMFIRNLAKEMISPDAERAMTTGKGGVGVILGSVSAKYFRPVVYPDQLLIAHKVKSIGKDRFKLESLSYSFAYDMDRQGCAVTGGTCEMVTYDYEKNMKIDIPPDMLLALEKRLT